MTRIAAIALAIIASSAMIVLALPPCGMWFFGWLALTPVFAATRDTKFLYGFLSGIAVSMLAAFLSTRGVFYRSGTPDGEPTWTYLGFGLFGTVFALIAGAAAEPWKERGIKYMVGMSAAAVLLEAALLWVMPAPFELSQARNRLMLEVASFTGIWGIGFLLWLLNLGLAQIRFKRWEPWVMAAIFFAFMASTNIRPQPHYDETIRMGAIQSDSVELGKLAGLTRQAAKAGAKLLVWCEFSGLAHAPNGNPSPLVKLAQEPNFPRFVTTYRDGHEPLPHNAAVVISKFGASNAYFKRKLFGSETKMHTPGTAAAVANTNSGEVGLNICYDTCFPAIMRDTAKLNPAVIAVPTIDPETPYAFFAACHAAFSPIRAAELGVPIIRADGFAYSSIVGPYGETIAELGPGENKWVVADVPITGYETVYRKFGDWFLWVCGAVLVWLASIAAWRILKNASRTRSRSRSEV